MGDFVGEECWEFSRRGFVLQKYQDSSRAKYPGQTAFDQLYY